MRDEAEGREQSMEAGGTMGSDGRGRQPEAEEGQPPEPGDHHPSSRPASRDPGHQTCNLTELNSASTRMSRRGLSQNPQEGTQPGRPSDFIP